MSGNAMIAITNKIGTGKKIKLHEFSVKSLAVQNSQQLANISLTRGTLDGNGIPCSLTPFDSTAILPEGINVYKECVFTPNTEVFTRSTYTQTSSAGLATFFQRFGTSQLNGDSSISIYRNKRKSYGCENIIVRPGEAVGLSSDFTSVRNKLFSVSYQIIVRGTPNRTFVGETVVIANPQNAFISFSNFSASDIFEIKYIDIRYIGTVDTTYLQLVPVGAVQPTAAADPERKVPVLKMDNSNPNLDRDKIDVLADVPILPFGVPEVYIAEGALGTPKGYNYLQTKDFVGPQYAVMFPEYAGGASTNYTTGEGKLLTLDTKSHNLLSPNTPLIIRPGEGLALVSGAETALVSSAVGTAGWQPLYISIVFSVENEIDPFLTLIGLQPGSDIVLLEPGTSNEIVNVDSNSGTTYSYLYDFDSLPVVDIAVYKAGFIPFFIRNLSLTSNGLSIPVSQVADRNYS